MFIKNKNQLFLIIAPAIALLSFFVLSSGHPNKTNIKPSNTPHSINKTAVKGESNQDITPPPHNAPATPQVQIPPSPTPLAPKNTPPPAAPTPPPPPIKTNAGSTNTICDPNYSGCVMNVWPKDVDCYGGQGDGPYYAYGPVQVIGKDIYHLDADKDGTACEKHDKNKN